MPTYQFEAMDSTGQEIKDVIEAPNEDEAQATIRQMGYFVTKISVKKARKSGGRKGQAGGKKRGRSPSAASSRRSADHLHPAVVDPAGRRPADPAQPENSGRTSRKPGRLKNCLMDVCDEIEGGSTLSEAMAKSPKAFDRLYVNMIKAGEAGGALEVILTPPGRVPGAVAVAQAQGQRGDGLSDRRRDGGRRHLDVHHDQDRAGVREDLQRLRSQTCRP